MFLEAGILRKHLICCFVPKCVLAYNVCLGFGFLCYFPVMFGSWGGLVGLFVCLFSVVGLVFSFSLEATASVEPTV